MEWRFVGREAERGDIVRQIRNGESVLLTGAPGVGKSRLAAEVEAALQPSHHVERLIGSPGVRALPFGSVTHLAGDVALPDPAVLLRYLTRALESRSRGRSIVVVVDDIDELDDGSLGFVHHLATREAVPVLATARADRMREPRVVSLWKDGHFHRRDLGPLSRSETESLAEAILRGAAAVELHNEIWRLSEGHPLFVRELLLESIDQGLVARVDGTWLAVGRLTGSRRVADLVRMRTAHLDDGELGALRALALCEPVALSLAKRIAPAPTLEALEEKELIRLEELPGGSVLRSSHPLVAEVTLHDMPSLTAASTTVRLARVLLEAPAVTSSGAMRAAMWLLDAGEQPPQDIAIRGAREALRVFDSTLGVRLAEAALAAGSSQVATVLLGRAHAGRGDAFRALSILQDAQQQASSEVELVAATVALAEVTMFNLGDPARAIRELDDALEGITQPGLRAELDSHRVLAAGMIGDFDLGLRIAPGVADNRQLPEPAQLRSAIATTLTQTMTGKLAGVDERLDRGEMLAERYAEIQPFARDQVGMNRLLALQAQCEFSAHERHADAAIRRRDGLMGGWLFVRSIVCQFTGDIDAGRRLANESQGRLREMDPLGLLPMAHSIRALFEAMGGDSTAAAEIADRARSDPRSAATRVGVWCARADAWIAVNRGATGDGAARAVEAGAAAAAGTHYVWAAFAFHDAVRFGHPELAVESLRDLARDGRGPLVALLAEHAAAAAARNPEALVALADRSRNVGALSVAGDCCAAAAAVCDGSEAARYTHLALRHYQKCHGLISPLARTLVAPLTVRQEEIGALAATGRTSKAIAQQLHLSVRTVDNHLRTVYAVFGVGGRSELPELFPL